MNKVFIKSEDLPWTNFFKDQLLPEIEHSLKTAPELPENQEYRIHVWGPVYTEEIDSWSYKWCLVPMNKSRTDAVKEKGDSVQKFVSDFRRVLRQSEPAKFPFYLFRPISGRIYVSRIKPNLTDGWQPKPYDINISSYIVPYSSTFDVQPGEIYSFDEAFPTDVRIFCEGLYCGKLRQLVETTVFQRNETVSLRMIYDVKWNNSRSALNKEEV